MDQSPPDPPAGALPSPSPSAAGEKGGKLTPAFLAHRFQPGRSGFPAGKRPGQLNLVNEQLRRAFLNLKIGQKTALDEIWTLALERARKGDDALLIELLKRVTVLASPELAGVTNIQINTGAQGVGGVPGISPGAVGPTLFNPSPEQLVNVIALATRLRLTDQIVVPHEPGIVDVPVEVLPAGGGNGNGGGNGHAHEGSA
jgi:hypothetical protein